ncbi:MAG: endonuclease MutS2 [Firmicutes bacterium]|nr:endonuclease MutS2 [Bacillota bacterium]
MNERTIRVLEFNKIRELLLAQASSVLGREKIEELQPATEAESVKQALKETTEARAIYTTEDFSLAGLTDVRASLRRAALGAVLPPEELLAIAALCAGSRRAYNFFQERRDVYPLLSSYALELVSCRPLEQAIDAAIDEFAEVRDGASSKLRTIRNEIRTLQSRLKQRLETMVRSPAVQKFLQEPLVTMRNERYVVPVKVEYRSQVPGIIHDQSASGATLFTEPMAAVEIGNDLRRKEAEEEQEVARILTDLSQQVQAVVDPLRNNLEILAQLDFVMAKGKLSYLQKATEPLINEEGYLDLKKARHPLLPAETVVPTNIHLGKDFSVLLITGPNTGGKTVTLKTVGLLTLMAQAGLHIPADEGSQVAVFQQVFADIGDEQSIEQSLSTFSSHMTNIIEITRQADHRSLVLLDELGAGTDPTEGAALAMAIIDYLYGRGCRLLATTHYSELKSYAYQREGVQNASVELDVETLRPTYRLTIGLPGKSNAFEIASRLGLAEDIIGHARTYLSGEQLRLEDLLKQLEASRIQTREEERAAYALRQEAEAKAAQLSQRLEQLKRKEKKILERAKQEARALVQSQRQEIERMLSDLRQALEQVQVDRANASQVMESARQTLRSLQTQTTPTLEKPSLPPVEIASDRDFKAGDEVLVKHLGQRGQLLDDPSPSGEVQVQLGALRLTCHVKQLEKLVVEKKQTGTSGFNLVNVARTRVPLELDLRGKTVDEALLEVDKYLDDACVAGLATVSIIHGKGTGALRQGVREFISKHQQVKSYRFGGPAEGGSGVTVVELRR